MSGVGCIPDEWILDQTPYHRFLLWAAWKSKGARFCLSVREVAYAIHVSKTAAERLISQARVVGLLSVAPVPFAREGAFYDPKGLLLFVSQEVSQQNAEPKIVGQTLGHKQNMEQEITTAGVKALNIEMLGQPGSSLGRNVGHEISVPTSVPVADKKPRRLPPSKREKERDKLLGSYHADTRMVLDSLVGMWPEERSNRTKIGCPFADTAARIDERLQEGIPAKDLIEAAKLYLEENKGFESEIRFFLGPGKPGSGPPKWSRYVRAIRFSAPTPALLPELAVN